MAFDVAVLITAAIIIAVGAAATFAIGLIRGNSGATKQLMGAFVFSGLAIYASAYGAMALKIPINNPSGTKDVHWGPRTADVLALPLFVASITFCIFRSFGLRVIMPVLILLFYGALALGPFVTGGFPMWYFFMIGCIFAVFFAILMIFGDRIDVVEDRIKGKQTEFPAWTGWWHRLLIGLGIALSGVLWCLAVDTTGVLSDTCYYIFAACVTMGWSAYAFLVWLLVTPVDPIVYGTIQEMEAAGRGIASSIAHNGNAKKQRHGDPSLDGYSVA